MTTPQGAYYAASRGAAVNEERLKIRGAFLLGEAVVVQEGCNYRVSGCPATSSVLRVNLFTRQVIC